MKNIPNIALQSHALSHEGKGLVFCNTSNCSICSIQYKFENEYDNINLCVTPMYMWPAARLTVCKKNTVFETMVECYKKGSCKPRNY